MDSCDVWRHHFDGRRVERRSGQRQQCGSQQLWQSRMSTSCLLQGQDRQDGLLSHDVLELCTSHQQSRQGGHETLPQQSVVPEVGWHRMAAGACLDSPQLSGRLNPARKPLTGLLRFDTQEKEKQSLFDMVAKTGNNLLHNSSMSSNRVQRSLLSLDLSISRFSLLACPSLYKMLSVLCASVAARCL